MIVRALASMQQVTCVSAADNALGPTSFCNKVLMLLAALTLLQTAVAACSTLHVVQRACQAVGVALCRCIPPMPWPWATCCPWRCCWAFFDCTSGTAVVRLLWSSSLPVVVVLCWRDHAPTCSSLWWLSACACACTCACTVSAAAVPLPLRCGAAHSFAAG